MKSVIVFLTLLSSQAFSCDPNMAQAAGYKLVNNLAKTAGATTFTAGGVFWGDNHPFMLPYSFKGSNGFQIGNIAVDNKTCVASEAGSSSAWEIPVQ